MRWLDGITDSMDMGLSKALGDGEGQGSLACCSPCGGKESDSAPEQQQLSVKCVCFGFNLAKMML